MNIAIGSDHRGFSMKQTLISYLKENGYHVIDCGTDSEEAVDYPIYAKEVSNKIKNHEAEYGILICGTGIGMSIAANKIKGIRCAKVSNKEEAELTRIDNDANIIALSYKTEDMIAKEIIMTFIKTKASLEERHLRRRTLIKELEDEY